MNSLQTSLLAKSYTSLTTHTGTMKFSMQTNYKIGNMIPIPQNPSKYHKIKTQKPIIFAQLSMKEKTNFYQTLSLTSQNVGFDEIKKAYKNMALRYHPDVCSAPLTKEESTKVFVELRNAYETLSDPNLRRIYDIELGLKNSLGPCLEIKRNSSICREAWER